MPTCLLWEEALLLVTFSGRRYDLVKEVAVKRRCQLLYVSVVERLRLRPLPMRRRGRCSDSVSTC